MKKFIIGIVMTFIILLVYSYFVLKVWGIGMFSAAEFTKIMASIGISFVASIIFTIVYALFFRSPSKKIEKTDSVMQKKLEEDKQQ